MRSDGRKNNELRNITIEPNYLMHPHGSVLISYGNTKVICSCFAENRVPQFLVNSGTGWITSEYSLLPGSTTDRSKREASTGKVTGRTHEIQRLIGRSLRTVVDLKQIGERTLWIDCDVIQADGGTRTAAITGSFVAMALALKHLKKNGDIKTIPLIDYVAAVSLGIKNGDVYLDLNYEEDFSGDVDMNIVMTGSGEFIEIQGTGEKKGFSQDNFLAMLELGKAGIHEIISLQKEIVTSFVPELTL